MRPLTTLVAVLWIELSRRTLGFSVTPCSSPLLGPTRFRHSTKLNNKQHVTPYLLLFSSNRDEEIAKLEEQLRQLKEEAEEFIEDDVKASTRVNISGEPASAPGKGGEFFPSERDLAEQGILDDESGGGSSLLATAALGFVAIVLLSIFSQVPVGQEDLSRYGGTASSSGASRIDLGDLNEAKSVLNSQYSPSSGGDALVRQQADDATTAAGDDTTTDAGTVDDEKEANDDAEAAATD